MNEAILEYGFRMPQWDNQNVMSENLEQFTLALSNSARPLILAGELARGETTRNLLIDLSNKIGAPVLSAYRCQDIIDNNHIAYAGHLEINPVDYQTQLFENSDFIIVLGSRLDGITSREETLIPAEKNGPIFIQILKSSSDLAPVFDFNPTLVFYYLRF